jgi:hypothetical protein
LSDLALRRLVKARVVDGDGGLRGDPGDDALRALGEHGGRAVAEEEAAERLARARHHGHREIAAHRGMPLGQVERRWRAAVARVAVDVEGAHDALAAKGKIEERRCAQHREARRDLARAAGQREQGLARAALLAGERKEGADFRAGEVPRGVGRALHQLVEVEFGDQRGADAVQHLQGPALLLVGLLGAAAVVDVHDRAGPFADRAVGLHQRHAALQHVAVLLARVMPEPPLEGIGTALRHGALPALAEAGAVIGVVGLHPAKAAMELPGLAGEGLPGGLRRDEGPARVGGPHDRGRGPDQRAVEKLAAAHRPLGATALGHVAREAGQELHALAPHARQRQLGRKPGAVAPQRRDLEPPVERVRPVRRQEAPQRLAFLLIRVGGEDEIGQEPAEGLLARPAEGRLRLPVPFHHEAGGIHDHDGVERRFDHRPQGGHAERTTAMLVLTDLHAGH